MGYYDDFPGYAPGDDPTTHSETPNLRHNTTWTTKTGVSMKFYEMETSHLENTIAMLERKGIEPPYLMKRELYMRGKQRKAKVDISSKENEEYKKWQK